MKAKKIAIGIFCIMIISMISFSNMALAVETYTTSREKGDIAKKTFEEWLEGYKSEEVPENRRITDYNMGAIRMKEVSENEFIADIEFIVTPVSIENTEWNYAEPEITSYYGHKCTYYTKTSLCYIKSRMENGEYQVEYIRETPEGYDEFTKRFKEYKKTHIEEVESTQIQGEETEKQLANQEIEKMSNGIIIGCSIILLAIICLIIVKVMRCKGKNNIRK